MPDEASGAMAVASASPLDVLVVQHTHWDREWYHPAGRFRQALIRLVDELLAPDGATPAASFLLDGQAVVIEDYLAVRPDRRDALSQALTSGAVEAGPWFVLADELIPRAEALIRNLLAGRETLSALGATAPCVLYCPDAFGHPASLPTLADGFGMRSIVLWRGFGGRRWPSGDASWWRAPDGVRSLLIHLPPGGYESGANLPVPASDARARWATVREVLAARARLGAVLVMNGADHHARQESSGRALLALQDAALPDRVRRVSLGNAAALLEDRARTATLPEVRGELRDSYGYAWTLQGTWGTRAHQKRRNAVAERLLVHDAEPWAALAAWHVHRDFSPLLRAAWRTLLLCHPHDTLCGCVADEPARAMDGRLDDAIAQGKGIRDDAILGLVGHDSAAARTRPASWENVVLVRNPAPRARGGVAELLVSTFRAHIPVGPGSHDTSIPVGPRGTNVAITGGLPLQVLGVRIVPELTESPRHYPDADLVQRTRAVAWIPPIPGFGIRAFAVREEAIPPSAAPPTAVRASARELGNTHLRIRVDRRGRVAIKSADGLLDVKDLIDFDDVGDGGDLYTHSPIGGVLTTYRCRDVRLVHPGPLRGTLELTYHQVMPRRRDLQGSPGHLAFEIRVRLQLDAGSPFLRLHVRGRNRSVNHRLRIVIATGVTKPRVVADAAFGPQERPPVRIPSGDRRAEHPPATAPLHRYVSLYARRHGATLYSDGLAEYEAGADGRVAVTLVRAVGHLSRADLAERPGHAAWPVPTPEAQCRRAFAGRFAVMAHGPRSAATAAHVERVAEDVLLPLTGRPLRSAVSVIFPSSGVELIGDGLAFSAALPVRDDGIMLRCVNVTDAERRGAWCVPPVIARACLARLDGTLLDALPVKDDTVSFTASPRGVVTVMVWRA
ncbi:MAG: alpha-mannosidase [Gemmatimonadaceae bacterium]